MQGLSTPAFATSPDRGLTVSEKTPDLKAVLPPGAAILDGKVRERNSLDNRKIGFDPIGPTIRTLAILATTLAGLPALAVFNLQIDRKTFDRTVPPLLIESQRIPIGPPAIAA